MGADDSPFVPQSAAELTSLKLSLAEERRRAIAVKVDRLTALLSKKGSASKEPTVSTSKDGRPLFFSSFSRLDEKDVGAAMWPTIVQLKEEGDRRAEGSHRHLPSPHKVYGKLWAQKAKDDVFTDDSWLGIIAVDGGEASAEHGTSEFNEGEVPSWVDDLMEDELISGQT